MGGMGDFKASVVKKFSKCLPRQVNEDIRMQEFESKGGNLLNSSSAILNYISFNPLITIFQFETMFKYVMLLVMHRPVNMLD